MVGNGGAEIDQRAAQQLFVRLPAFGWYFLQIEQSNDLDAVAFALKADQEKRGRSSLY